MTTREMSGWINRSEPAVRRWCDAQNAVLAKMESTFAMPGAPPGDDWFLGETRESQVFAAEQVTSPLLSTIRTVARAACEDRFLSSNSRWAARLLAGRADRIANHIERTLGVIPEDWA